MKKAVTLLVLLMSVIQLSAQNRIMWKKITDKKDDYVFNDFYQFSDKEYKAVFTLPEKKAESKKISNIYIRTYNSDISSFTEKNIPPESPKELMVMSFNKYSVIYGSRDENNAPVEAGKYKKDNQIIIADAQLNPLTNVLFPLHQKKRNFYGIPNVTVSSDSNYMFVENIEVLNPNAPKDNFLVKHYITVFDKDLKQVWNDSIDFPGISEQKTEPDVINYEFVKGKLLIMASNDGIPQKKIKPSLFVLLFDKPHSYKQIFNKTFEHNSVGWDYVFTKDNALIINGINIAGSSPYVNGMLFSVGVTANSKKDLFFVKFNLDAPDPSSPIFINYNADKQFAAKYHEDDSDIDKFISYPTDVLMVNDGIIFCSEHHTLETSYDKYNLSTTTMHNRQITFIKFDFQGNITWVNGINKHIGSTRVYEGYFFKPFIVGNDVLVFYYDIEKNVNSDKLKTQILANDNALSLVTARVDTEGKITKTIHEKIGDADIYSYLPGMKQISDHRFFLLGLELGNKVVSFGDGQIKNIKGGYIGFYNIED